MTAKLIGGFKDGQIVEVDESIKHIAIPIITEIGFGRLVYSREPNQDKPYLNSPAEFILE